MVAHLRKLLMGSAGNTEPYWLWSFTASSSAAVHDIDVDGSGNVFGAGDAVLLPYVFKLDRTGNALADSSLTTGESITQAQGIVAVQDGSGDIIATYGSTGNGAAVLHDYRMSSGLNSVGNRWTYGAPGGYSRIHIGITRASDGSIYHAYIYNPSSDTNNYIVVAKINPANGGTLLWERGVGGNTPYANIQNAAMGIDLSGNVYVAFNSNYYSNSGDLSVAKYDNNGNLLWQKSYYRYPYNMSPSSIAFDNVGNIYIGHGGYSAAAGKSNACITKAAADGTWLWTKNYTVDGTVPTAPRVYNSPSGDVVYVRTFTLNNFRISKLNTSIGALTGFLYLPITETVTINFTTADMKFIGRAMYLIGGYTANGFKGFVLKMPIDGSHKGTYALGTATYTLADDSAAYVAADLTLSASSWPINSQFNSGLGLASDVAPTQRSPWTPPSKTKVKI